MFARGSLKKLLARRTSTQADAVAVAVEALYDAADDDSATGGPDLVRRISRSSHDGDRRRPRRVPDDEIAARPRSIAAPPRPAPEPTDGRPER